MKAPKFIIMSVAIIFLISVTYIIASPLGFNKQSPEYFSDETKEIVEKMIEAHGGMYRWKNAPTISYDNIFMNPYQMNDPAKNPWWIAHEVIEQGKRRVYQEWPLNESLLVYDGEKVFTQNWGLGNYPNFMQQFFFYFLNLPWLTQDSNVKLGKPGQGRLANLEKDFITIEMSFTEAPTIGKTADDKFVLFIDPDSFMLKGYHYYNGFRPQLDIMGIPKDKKLFGPMARVLQTYVDVDGLKFPNRFYTGDPEGKQIFGYHSIINYSISKEFDESKMEMTSNSIIDESK